MNRSTTSVLYGLLTAMMVFTSLGGPCASAQCVPPAMTAQPSGQAVCPSATSVTFAAAASGSPTPTVQWQVSTNSGASFSNVAGATGTQLVVAANNSIPVTGPVFLILMENENWASISGNASAPYINSTVLPMASYATQYYNPPGLHPSEPNYLWLEAGTNFGILDDNDPSVNSQTTTNHLATQLKNAGLSWRGYEESIPAGACPLTNTGPTDSSGDPEYAVRHEPFCFFDDVTCNQNTACAYCIANVVPYTQLAGDLSSNTVARYNFITPNLCDDMHDTCTPLSNEILQGDTWLSNNLPQILASQAYRNGGVVFITWDEGENGDGPIGMIVLSPVAKGGGYNNAIHYTHSSTLRTVQEILGVGPLLGDAANATDLSDLFQTGPSLNASQCRALFTNTCGSATSTVATLTISIPPAISNQPSPQTVCSGEAAQFIVGATGTGPLTYQWRQAGWGAGGWQLATTGTNGTGGLFIGSSTVNGGGDPDSTGDIDTAHQAWGLYANAGALSQAIRPFNGLMAVGQTFKIAMDNGYLNNATQNGGTIGAGSVGFGLQDVGGTNRFEFYFSGGDSQYRIHDASSTSNATGISFTDQGLDLAFTLTGVNTYSVTVSAADSDGPAGLPLTFTGTLTGTAGTSIDQVRLFNYSAGVGQTYDAYFSSISIGAKADNAADPLYASGWTNGQNGGTVTITNGAEFSGATNATLTISPAGSADAGSYNVQVSGACTPSAVSATASLSVNPSSGCLLVAITSPPNETYISTTTVAVSGIGSAASGVSGVTVDGTPATSANGFTNWTATVSGLASCINTLMAVATDTDGNTATNLSHVIVTAGSVDCNGDGLPDAWQIQYFGCVSCAQAAPSADPDHDGFTNLEEFQAGTDPTNPLSSPFRITSITRRSNDMLFTWTTAGGTTNVVQATGGVGGSYSTNFANLSPLIDVAGNSLTSTNYLDAGGATNMPARYYRVAMPSSQAQAVTQALDNAADPAYSGGWTNGSNGGTGLGSWTLTGSGVLGSNTNGFFIGSSTNNAFDTSPGIDVSGKSWGVYANKTNFTAAYRGFNTSVSVGGTVKVDMDNGFIDTGYSDGFVLRNGNATNSPAAYNTNARFEFLYLGGDSSNSYKVVDEAGLYNIGVPFTGTGLHLTFTLNTADTYTLRVVDNASGATNATVNGTLSGTAGSTVDSIAVYNRNAGSGSTADCYFNSLQIISP